MASQIHGYFLMVPFGRRPGGAAPSSHWPMAHASFAESPDHSPPPPIPARPAYPPPVYRRDEDVYVIGENAGRSRTRGPGGRAA